MPGSVSGMAEVDVEEGERLSLVVWLRASFRLSRGSGLRLAMRACAMEFVSMLVVAGWTDCRWT